MAEKYTNLLIHETSPYLLQHAHNPVNWYPWGKEALDRARNEDKPILVSIGYSACHWCHVMERESFEDTSVAEMMNDLFINIKIDREERPDLDHIYMDALQAMTGSGGWPLNVFLTPEGKPFYGGTYFPPKPMHNRPSWMDVLTGIGKAYKEKKEEIREQADQMVKHLEQSNGFGITAVTLEGSPESRFSIGQLQEMKDQIMGNADKQWGGFGRAPKFPQSFQIQYLLQYHHFFGDGAVLEQAKLSMDKMMQGGIYDHIGGGFARYSTDTEWLVPHFEKMTYDNALLAVVLADLYRVTNDNAYAETLRQTLGFMQREMMTEEKGFYSALDADSERVEGKYYTWSKKEFAAVTGEDEAILAELFDITEQGNWEHMNIPWLKEKPDVFARSKGYPPELLNKKISEAKQKLLKARNSRVRPLLDDKCLLGWNALMNIALTKACTALGEDAYLTLAEQNMQFLFEHFYDEATGEWYHTFKNGKAKYPAFLDDYAYLVQALIALNECSGKRLYLNRAEELTREVIRLFSDEKTPMFFYTRKDQEDIIIRKKEVYDGAIPSGNAVMAGNLHQLGILKDIKEWKDKSFEMISAVHEMAVRYPSSFGVWACFIMEFVVGTMEIAVIGKEAMLRTREILYHYIPNKVLQWSEVPEKDNPLLMNKAETMHTVFYLCKEYSCRKPVNNKAEFMQLIEKERASLKSPGTITET